MSFFEDASRAYRPKLIEALKAAGVSVHESEPPYKEFFTVLGYDDVKEPVEYISSRFDNVIVCEVQPLIGGLLVYYYAWNKEPMEF